MKIYDSNVRIVAAIIVDENSIMEPLRYDACCRRLLIHPFIQLQLPIIVTVPISAQKPIATYGPDNALVYVVVTALVNVGIGSKQSSIIFSTELIDQSRPNQFELSTLTRIGW